MSERLPDSLEAMRQFDRNSPTLENDLEVFAAEIERWQRGAGIDGFIRTVLEEGDLITVRLLPYSKTPNAKIPPPPDALRIGPKKDGFEKQVQAQVALDSTPVNQVTIEGSKELESELKSLLRGRRGGV